MSEPQADIGLIGLAVMGQNLVLNMADHGYTVAVYNRTTETMDQFIAKCKAEEPSAERVLGFAELADFVKAIKKPRKMVILVKSTAVLPHDRDAVDKVIEQLLPLLDKGDIIIDGGNSNWNATIRREKDLTAQGYEFIGSGVSGGELGARFGPSLMPGGSKQAWQSLKPIWEAISAKVDKKTGKPCEDYKAGVPIVGGEPCTTHIGADGAGHYVKMVHNGIEYIDMQLICEAYNLMKTLLGMKPDEMSKVFGKWNKGVLDSFLIEITTDILQQKDPAKKGKGFLVDKVLDTAGQKGTGKWTSTSALDLGIPANAIAEAVFARCLSALKDERVAASKKLKGPKGAKAIKGKKKLVEAIHDALYSSKICAYAQGFQLMAEAAKEYKWTLNFGEIAKIFRGGCIIRARFLQKITEAYEKDAKLQNLMLDPFFKKELHRCQDNWRKVVSLAAEHGVSIPAFMSALAYFDGYRSAVLPANLLQAQRDYFGAHTYERTDQPRGKFFHVDWPEANRPQLDM
ncbi:MAG: decarboxylating NADP(+)-dependent phosphogluconate dehydrogenase [Phycisphaera sp.]|nr:decarboxylating NADP(+)-dependent phosphogluconate dehydrogenase [Phycisphaera sp.]